MNYYGLNRPEALESHILENADRTYIIYNKDWCYCTRCDSTYRRDKKKRLKQNHDTTCDKCGNAAIAKSEGRGRQNIEEKGSIFWTQVKDGITYCQLDKYEIDYTEIKPKVWLDVRAQYKLGNKPEGKRVKYDWGTGWFWQNMKSIRVPRYNPYCINPYDTKVMNYCDYDPKLGDDLKYCNIYRIVGEHPTYALEYMLMFCKYKSIELLDKAGFETLVDETIQGKRNQSVLNLRGKTLEKILKMTKGEYKHARDFDLVDLWTYQVAKPYGVHPADIKGLSRYRTEEHLEKLKTMGVVKALQYIGRQNERATKNPMDSRDYLEYIEWIYKLGDRIDKRSLFPEEFWKAHDDTMKRFENQKLEHLRESFSESELTITGMTEPFVFGGLMIRPAATPEELINESVVLNHCVKTYVDKVAKGHTSILFIRRVQEPETPYFTLELDKNRKIVQCRGDHNCSYPEEVQDLIDNWYKKIITNKIA